MIVSEIRQYYKIYYSTEEHIFMAYWQHTFKVNWCSIKRQLLLQRKNDWFSSFQWHKVWVVYVWKHTFLGALLSISIEGENWWERGNIFVLWFFRIVMLTPIWKIPSNIKFWFVLKFALSIYLLLQNLNSHSF